LVTTPDVLALLSELGRLHGRTSYEWNGEDGRRGRQVWCKAAETGMKSERHFWATMNYVHNNPVRHRVVRRWQDWPFGSAIGYLNAVGTDEAKRVWQEYPVADYGKEWDPVEM
jgi:putative transposase